VAQIGPMFSPIEPIDILRFENGPMVGDGPQLRFENRPILGVGDALLGTRGLERRFENGPKVTDSADRAKAPKPPTISKPTSH